MTAFNISMSIIGALVVLLIAFQATMVIIHHRRDTMLRKRAAVWARRDVEAVQRIRADDADR